MGIMSKKVTRRVALGSVAGGLAGTALVIRALKGRYDVKLIERKMEHKDPDYDKDWEKYTAMVSVPIKQLDDPSNAIIDYRLKQGAQYR